MTEPRKPGCALSAYGTTFWVLVLGYIYYHL
jgi:hypothetical protein